MMIKGSVSNLYEDKSVFDFSIGRGGDLAKWSEAGINTVYGSDIDEQGLGTQKMIIQLIQFMERLKNLQRGTGKIKKWAENVNITVVRQSMSDNMIEKTQLLQKNLIKMTYQYK